MTARKPAKPKPRKRSAPTLEQRVRDMEAVVQWNGDCIDEINKRITGIETRAHFRDASHDEPVSNAGEAIGQHFRIVGEPVSASWWCRFWNFMGSAS